MQDNPGDTLLTMSTASEVRDVLPRPSHPTPSTASRPFPIPPPVRPKLRIITGADDLPVLGPRPIRHPTAVKTAPLINIYADTTLPKVSEWRQQLSPVHRLDTPLVKRVRRPGQGHKRRLSDKFKNLFSAIHFKRDDRIPFFQVEYLDENRERKNDPTRPHRSPGTASFLVSRHLAPRSDLPHSAHSSSTAWSRRPGAGEGKGRKWLLPEAEISHFSNPTTLSSATSRSEAGSTPVAEIAVARQDRLDAVIRAVSLRRTVSLPDMTL